MSANLQFTPAEEINRVENFDNETIVNINNNTAINDQNNKNS